MSEALENELLEYAKDWRTRAAGNDVVLRAAAELKRLRAATALDRPVDGERARVAQRLEDEFNALTSVLTAEEIRVCQKALRTPPAEPSGIYGKPIEQLIADIEATPEGKEKLDAVRARIQRAEPSKAQLLAAKNAIQDEVGSQLCAWNCEKRFCREMIGGSCWCAMAARAALTAAGVTGRPGVEEIKAVALGASLPDGYQWGAEAMEHFNMGKRCAAESIAKLLEPSA